MLNPIYLVLILILTVSCSSAEKTKSAKLAEINYTYGTQALMTKDFTNAITYLMKAAELNPNDPQTQNNLGMAYYFKGDKVSAKQHIERAIELDPKNTDALSNLGSFLFEQGDLSGAEKIYARCLKDLTYEKQARVYLNLSLIEQRRGNTPKSIAYLRNAVKEDDQYCPAWFQLGQMEFRSKNFKEAAKNFKQAGMGPCANDPAPLYWQAATLVEQREYLNARIKFDDLMTRFPTSTYTAMAKEKLSQITLLEQHSSTTESATSPLRESSTPTF